MSPFKDGVHFKIIFDECILRFMPRINSFIIFGPWKEAEQQGGLMGEFYPET